MSDQSLARQTVVLLAVFVEGGLLLMAWALGWLLDCLPLQTFRWELRGALWGLAATVPMFLVFLAMVRWPVGPLGRIKRFSEDVLVPLLSPCSVVDLLGIALLAGLGEEMLFRGVLQPAFAYWMKSPWAALALASVLFGMLHAVTSAYAVLATLLGAYLGALWVYTDNLMAPVLAHFLYDFLALLFLVRGPGARPEPGPGAEEPLSEEKEPQEPGDGREEER